MTRWLVALALLAACGKGKLDRPKLEHLAMLAHQCQISQCVELAADQIRDVSRYDQLTGDDKTYVDGLLASLDKLETSIHEHEDLTRREIFVAAITSCRTAIIEPDDSTEQKSDFESIRESNAKLMGRIGVAWEPYPHATGDYAEETRAILDWHTRAMAMLANKLTAYSPATQALVPLSVDTCELLYRYTPDAPWLDKAVSYVETDSKAANVDPKRVTELVEALRKRPASRQGREAVLDFNVDVAKSLDRGL